MNPDPVSSLEPTEWLKHRQWDRFEVRGPQGFEEYARLRFVPDPEFSGQSSAGIDFGRTPAEIWQIGVILTHLAAHTATPDECYFGIIEGWPELNPQDAAVFTSSFRRSYRLFRGATWSLPHESHDHFAQSSDNWNQPIPSLIWPRDHSWFITRDLDPHFATIAGSTEALAELVAIEDVDVVLDPGPEFEPAYYDA